jgi:TolB-like protein/Flp pilus assembly protein TadD
MQAVWPDSFVEESNLTNNIWMLRTALRENTNEKYIETVPKRGYRFVADVRSVASVDIKSDTANNQQALLPRLSWQKATVGFAAIVLAAGIGIGLWYQKSARIKPNITAIAVLPFVNTSNNPDTEYLSDGVTESLINNLSQLSNLKVIAQNSSFKYKGKEVNPEEVARTLGVDAILIGNVSQRGDEVLISVELINTHDKTQMWGEQYKRKASDLLQVQSEISREIAQRLRVQLAAGQEQQLARKKTTEPEAYELYLKGRFYWLKGGSENAKKAIDFYHRSITLDPSYADAYAEIAVSYSMLSSVSEVNGKEFLPEAVAAAQKAVELDENSAEAHLALGFINIDKWDWTGSEREIKRAIELNPNLVRGHRFYSLYLSLVRRHQEAIAEAKLARELDPLSPQANFCVAYTLAMARQSDQAIEAARKILELDADSAGAYGIIGGEYVAKGQFHDAIAAFQQAIALGNDSPDGQVSLAIAYAKAGQRNKARLILKQLESNPNISPTTLAPLYVTLDETERALTSLEKAYDARDSQLQFLAVDSNLDPLRSNPRFEELMRKVGLSQ